MIILQLWMRYRVGAIPPNAPPIQIRDTRRAFYAGAKALFNFIGQNITQTPKSGPSQVDINTVNHINKELEAFCELVADGKDEEV